MTRTRLRVELLEPRDVPAGNVTAAVVNGVLVLTGDDNNNSLTFQMATGGVTLSPDSGTSVNGQPANTQVTLPGATGLTADLGGGDDALTLVGNSDLILPKGATIALGDGFNNLNLVTTGTIDLASLAVTGTDGFDQVHVSGGVGNPNKISGAASFKPGDGGGQTELENLNLPGPAGLKMTAGIGDDYLVLNNVTVAKTVTANLGQGAANGVIVTGGQIGALTATAFGGDLTLTNTTVKGNASFSTYAVTQPVITGTTIGGTLTVKSTAPAGVVGGVFAHFFGTGALGGLAIDSVSDVYARFELGSSYTVARDVAVTSRDGRVQAVLGGDAITARSLTLTSPLRDAELLASSAGHASMSGNVTVSGVGGAILDVSSGGKIESAGDVKVLGTNGFAEINITDSDLKARNVTVTGTVGGTFFYQQGTSAIDLTGRLTIAGNGNSEADFYQGTGATMTVAGDLILTSPDVANFNQGGANTKLTIGGNWNVRSDFGTASVRVLGQSLSVAGATTLDGGYNAKIDISTMDVSRLALPVALTAGTRISNAQPGPREVRDCIFIIFGVAFLVNRRQHAVLSVLVHLFKSASALVPADTLMKGINATARDPGLRSDIQIGSPGQPVTVDGDLIVVPGGADDAVTLRAVTVTGKTTILTGGGDDTLTIDDGSTFTGTFFTDLGTGSDTIAIAQDTGQSAPVTFTGKATFLAGSGSDTLQLGLLAGDPNSKAVFVAAGSTIDGGTGVNVFDDELGQFSGIVLGTGIVGWIDPTP